MEAVFDGIIGSKIGLWAHYQNTSKKLKHNIMYSIAYLCDR